MARKSGSTISQEELYPPPEFPMQGDFDEARLVEPFDVTALIGEIVDVRRGLAPAVAENLELPLAAAPLAAASPLAAVQAPKSESAA